jgi:hypothetical protein
VKLFWRIVAAAGSAALLYGVLPVFVPDLDPRVVLGASAAVGVAVAAFGLRIWEVVVELF